MIKKYITIHKDYFKDLKYKITVLSLSPHEKCEDCEKERHEYIQKIQVKLSKIIMKHPKVKFKKHQTTKIHQAPKKNARIARRKKVANIQRNNVPAAAKTKNDPRRIHKVKN